MGDIQDAEMRESFPWSIDDGSTGVEIEDTSSGVEFREPFDPTLIRVNPMPMNVDLLLKRIARNELDLSPGFQRKGGIWTEEAQSKLIESILIRIPIPNIYVDATDDDHWLIVDGLQRLTALKRFACGKLRLRGLEFLTDLNGQTYNDLPPRFRRRILETQIFVHAIQEGTPPKVKFNIFKRINTGGLPLSAQEIRHALYQGKATEFLVRMAGSREFLRAVDNGISDKRMAAQECVLRFAAFTLTPYTAYRTSDLDGFLNEAMEKTNSLPDTQIEQLQSQFLRVMEAAREIFGGDAFRKRYTRQHGRYPINKALFEAWSVNLGELSQEQRQVLIQKKERLIERFMALMDERDFDEAVSQGTGDVRKVKRRFKGIERVIQEVLA
jgi:hypothetical protein